MMDIIKAIYKVIKINIKLIYEKTIFKKNFLVKLKIIHLLFLGLQ
jgi:hypothetical protein